MKTYYAVITSYFDDGRATASLINMVLAEKKPEDTFNSTRRCDCYIDWFETQKEALEYIEDTRKA